MTAKEKLKNIEREFAEVINRNGLDNLVGIPDFIIAEFIVTSISALKTAHGKNKVHGDS